MARSSRSVPRRGPERRKPGQVLVELVLVLPILLAIASGILEIGVLVFDHLQLTGAVAEVTKLAYQNNRTPAQLQTVFDTSLGLDTSNRTFNVTTIASDPLVDNLPSVVITATYNQPYVGFFRWTGAPTYTLTSTSRSPVLTLRTAGALHNAVFPP